MNQNNYSGQIVIENNISVFNGATGIQAFLNAGSSPNAKIYIRQNTTYGNQTGRVNSSPCAEINLNYSLSSEVYGNLIETGGGNWLPGGDKYLCPWCDQPRPNRCHLSQFTVQRSRK